jgi:hypothetical protein
VNAYDLLNYKHRGNTMTNKTTQKQLDIIEYARNLYNARKLMDEPITQEQAMKIAEQKVIDMYNKAKA